MLLTKLYHFFAQRVFTDIPVKVAHIAIVLLFIFATTSGSEGEVITFAQSIGLESFDLPFSDQFSVFETQVLFATGLYLIISFQLSNLIKNWKFDIITQFVPLVAITVIPWFAPVPESIPFQHLNAAFLINATFATSIRLSRAEKEHKFLRSVFGQYVNRSLLETILSKGSTMDVGGQHREMSVLFSDIRGFTTLSESLTPRTLVRVLNQYLQSMSEVILEKNGTIDKYIGDAIMAFWNAPKRNPNHATDSIAAAFQMLRRLEIVRATVPELSTVQIGIGIATGPMVVGNLGGNQRFEYTVIGDTVNLASRLESLTKQYRVSILINEQAMQQSKTQNVLFREVDTIIVKGKTQEVTIFEPMIDSSSNRHLIQQYDRARATMLNGNVSEAQQMFRGLAQNGDGPSALMLERLGAANHQNARIQNVWQWDSK